MILLTDGVDNFTHYGNDEAIAAIQRARASVYIVSPTRAIMSELNDPQLVAIRVKFINQVSGNLDLAAVEVEFAPLGRA